MTVPTPADFAAECRRIVANGPGHDTHREMDVVTAKLLRGLGYGEGADVFEAAVAEWHRAGLAYP